MDQKTLNELIKRRHPRYDDSLAHWEFLEACYRGGREWFADNIFRYLKEGDKEFSERVERAYRFNHSREVCDLINKYIFKGDIQRNQEDAPDSVTRFWERSTRNRQPIGSLMRSISLRSSITGLVYAVVDNPSVTSPLSVKEAKNLDLQTYAYLVGPQKVLDISYDDYGQIRWILIEETERDDEDPFLSSGIVEPRYRLWTRDTWHVYKLGPRNKVVLDREGENALGRVPVVRCDHIESEDVYSTPSLIGDIAYLDRAVANYLSNLDAIIQDQTFSQLAMPAQGLMPGDEGYAKLAEMGTKRLFTFDGEHGAAPFFLSPDPKQAQMIITAIKQIINEIYHTVGMAGERTKQDNAMGIDNSSGVAKAYDFERVNALLAAKADSLDRIEGEIADLVAEWNNEDTQKDLVKYPDSFDVRGLADELDIAERLALVDAPDATRREQMRVVIEKLFPRASKETKKTMVDELDDWPSAPEMPVAFGAEPGDGLPGPGQGVNPGEGNFEKD